MAENLINNDNTSNNDDSNDEIFSPANHRRFSNRKRKTVENLTYNPQINTTKKLKKKINKRKENKKEENQNKNEENDYPLINGTEIIINTKINENRYFNGEVLVVKEYNQQENSYKLEMANPCSGLWGTNINKTENFLLRYAKILKSPNVPLIQIEFSLLNAVYDIRSSSKSKKYPVQTTLTGWRWLDSWDKLTWSTQPVQFSYQHILNLARVALEDHFEPIHGIFYCYITLLFYYFIFNYFF